MKNFKITFPQQIVIDSSSIKFLLVNTLFILISLSTLASSKTDSKNEKIENLTVINIEGTINAKDGPLPGAVAYLKGSEIGTTTDKDGYFKFPQAVKTGDILVFSFIGYQTYELEITKDTPTKLTILLEEESIEITGAILTKCGTKDKPNVFSKLFSKVKALF